MFSLFICLFLPISNEFEIDRKKQQQGWKQTKKKMCRQKEKCKAIQNQQKKYCTKFTVHLQ